MEQQNFERRFLELQTSFMEERLNYNFKSEEEIWENIGSHPLDIFFTRLAELYLDSNPSQRQSLYNYCGTNYTLLENLWYFIRRIGMLIHSQADKRCFEIGIAGALLDGGRADFRDLIVSLILLRFLAEKRGIDAKLILDDFIRSCEGEINSILENVRNHSRSDINFTVMSFGPSEWK